MISHLRRIAQETGPRSNLLGVAILFVIVNLTFFPFIWGDRTLQESSNQAPSLYNVGSRQQPVPVVAARDVDPGAAAWYQEPTFAVEHRIIFEQKEPPIWNPYASYGTPLAADAESQPYTPFTWIPITWSNARAYDIFVALRIFVGAAFAFLFLRLFLQFVPALVGAVAFLFSGYYWYFLTITHLSVEVLLPAMLYALERVLRRPNPGSAALLGFIVAWLILGGMPESAVLAVLFCTLYVIGRIVLDRDLRAMWGVRAAHVVVGTVLGIGLSALMLVPLFEFLPISWSLHHGWYGPGADVISWSRLGGYLAPLYLRPWSFGADLRGFFGCSALFFALVGFFSGIDDVIKRRWIPGSTSAILVFGIVAFALLGKRFGAFFINWIGYLPILRQIIFSKYEEAIIGCCIALLAGFGVARITEKRAPAVAIWSAALIPLIILTAAAGETRQAFLKLTLLQNFYSLGLTAAVVFLGLAAAATAALYAGKLKVSYFALTALALVLAEPLSTYVVPIYYVVNVPPPQSSSALLGAPYVDYLKSHLTDNSRLITQYSVLFPQWSGAFGFEDVRGLSAFSLDRYLPFFEAFLPDPSPRADKLLGDGHDLTSPSSRRFLALSSIRFIVTTTKLPPAAAFRETYTGADSIRVVRFDSPLPRLSIFQHVVNVATREEALRTLTSDAFDPYSEAVVEGNSPVFRDLSESPRAPVQAGNIEVYKSTYVKASVKTDRTSVAVLNDTNFPGWSVSIDGRPVPVFFANYLFRGVLVPSGMHVIEYRYVPRSFVLGVTISLISLFVLGWMCLTGPLKNWRNRNAHV
jgi:hypothetical protein